MIPTTEWAICQLGDSARWLSGGTPRKSKPEYWGGSIPWISAKSLHDFHVRDSEDRVTELGAENGTKLVPKDTILFVVRGMSLKSEFRMGITQNPVTFNQDLKALIAKDNFLPLFLAYAIKAQTPKILGIVGEAGHGTGKLPTDVLQKLEIPCPPLPEQRRIAAILGALDDKIELNRQMNATLEDMAQAIFKSWFIDFDGHDDLVESELGPIPRGWEVKYLADVTTKIGSGATPRGGKKSYVEEGVYFVRSQNVFDHRFSWDGLVKITEHAAAKLKGVTLHKGDVLINITGDGVTFIRTCVVDPDVLPARVNQHVSILRPSDPKLTRYLHLWMVRGWTKNLLKGFTAGGTRRAITKGHLQRVPIIVPPLDLLQRFKTFGAPLFKRVEQNSKQSRALAELRDALLPKLISGEIRVPEAEEQVEDAVKTSPPPITGSQAQQLNLL